MDKYTETSWSEAIHLTSQVGPATAIPESPREVIEMFFGDDHLLWKGIVDISCFFANQKNFSGVWSPNFFEDMIAMNNAFM